MQLHKLQLTIKSRKKKRIGRGGKRGTFSGRGQKGQKARAGRKLRPAERDLFQRLPKLKGVKNRSLKPVSTILNLGDLEKYFGEGLINRAGLLEKKIIKKFSAPVKILSNGKIKNVFTIEGIAVSENAKSKIEAAGGTVKKISESKNE